MRCGQCLSRNATTLCTSSTFRSSSVSDTASDGLTGMRPDSCGSRMVSNGYPRWSSMTMCVEFSRRRSPPSPQHTTQVFCPRRNSRLRSPSAISCEHGTCRKQSCQQQTLQTDTQDAVRREQCSAVIGRRAHRLIAATPTIVPKLAALSGTVNVGCLMMVWLRSHGKGSCRWICPHLETLVRGDMCEAMLGGVPLEHRLVTQQRTAA